MASLKGVDDLDVLPELVLGLGVGGAPVALIEPTHLHLFYSGNLSGHFCTPRCLPALFN